MGIGHDLGLQLRDWIQSGMDLSSSPALTNRLMDALGASPALRAPLRDLAAQPLTLRVLRLRGAEQQAALQALRQLLAETYSPGVLEELVDLLEAATGLSVVGSRPPQAVPAAADRPSKARQERRRVSGRRLLHRYPRWERELLAIAPGLLAGAIGALVLAWGAQELDRWTFERIGWSTGVGLAVMLVAFQLLTLVPGLRSLRRRWWLETASSGDPHRIWSWVSAPWIHGFTGEALLHGLLVVIVLGPTPLGAGKLVLRYTLTCLACQGAAVLVARCTGVERRWAGAAGAMAALLALAATLSVLKGQELAFPAGPLTIPAWVLLVVYAALQLTWELPRHGVEDHSRPIDRLWSSPWWWGSLGGVAWALTTRAGELIGPLLQASPRG